MNSYIMKDHRFLLDRRLPTGVRAVLEAAVFVAALGAFLVALALAA